VDRLPSESGFEDEEPILAEAEAPITDADLAEEMRAGAEVLRKLLTMMDIDAQVTSRLAQPEAKEPQHYLLEIQGRELGALIGRRGETLAALQYLTRLLTSRALGRRVHLVVDVEGYKARREQMLRRLAQRMAEQAVQRGRTVSMEPMPPHERRIVHLALREHPDVTTESVGEGDRRKVTVVPRRPNP
jgi:spoIIIJ-associated protein